MKALVRYTERLAGRIEPPSSKNYTTRYLLAAALAAGESLVRFPASSDDASAMQRCLADLGAHLRPGVDAEGPYVAVRGFGGRPRSPGCLDPGNAGAVLRLLMGVGALLPEVRFATAHATSLGRRPHGDLLDALAQLGVSSESSGGCLPVVLRGGPPRGGSVTVSGARSSQYLSALLFLAPLLPEGMTIEVTGGLVSQPLVRTTVEVLRQAGIELAASDDLCTFRVPGGQAFQPREYRVNGDWPSAAAVLVAAALTRGRVELPRLSADSQGEQTIVPVLRAMGVDVTHDHEQVTVTGGLPLQAVAVDGDQATDMVLAVVAAAALASGTSRIYGIANLRLKECDRLAVPAQELGRLGVNIRPGVSSLTVTGNPAGFVGGMAVATHHDHRVVQLLTLVGLRCRDGLTILEAENVTKSYPAFFDDLIRLGANISLVD